jgi:hypothetical protein
VLAFWPAGDSTLSLPDGPGSRGIPQERFAVALLVPLVLATASGTQAVTTPAGVAQSAVGPPSAAAWQSALEGSSPLVVSGGPATIGVDRPGSIDPSLSPAGSAFGREVQTHVAAATVAQAAIQVSLTYDSVFAYGFAANGTLSASRRPLPRRPGRARA